MIGLNHFQLTIFALGLFGLIAYFATKFIIHLDRDQWNVYSVIGAILLPVSGGALFFWTMEFLFFPHAGRWELWGELREARDLLFPMVIALCSMLTSIKFLRY